jgi:hypothetical protein
MAYIGRTDMKKKLIRVLAAIFWISTLFGCGNSSSSDSNPKIYMKKSSSADSFILINSSSLEDLITLSRVSKMNDFMLFVYQDGCTACTMAKKHLKTFISNNKYMIYGIPYTYYAELTSEDASTYPSATWPDFFFYSGGKPVARYDGIVASYTTFESDMKKFFYQGSYYLLNALSSKTGYEDSSTSYTYDSFEEESTQLLDEAKGKSDAPILFTWKRCSDCAGLFDNYLWDYISKNPSKDFFGFEVDYFRNFKPALEPTDPTSTDYLYWKRWADFASLYGLDNYLYGKVPCLISYKDASFDKMVVYHNEGEIINSNGVYSFSSAYNSEITELTSDSEESLIEKGEEKEFALMRTLYE